MVRELAGGTHTEKLSHDNSQQFIDFFMRNNTEDTKKNFHPFEIAIESLKKTFSDIHRDFYVGVFDKNSEMIGFGMLRGWDEGYIVPSLGILVDEEMRGRGIGSRLVEYLVDVAKENGSKSVRLSVYGDNIQAINIYHRCGFEVTSKKKNVSGRIMWILSRNVV